MVILFWGKICAPVEWADIKYNAQWPIVNDPQRRFEWKIAGNYSNSSIWNDNWNSNSATGDCVTKRKYTPDTHLTLSPASQWKKKTGSPQVYSNILNAHGMGVIYDILTIIPWFCIFFFLISLCTSGAWVSMCHHAKWHASPHNRVISNDLYHMTSTLSAWSIPITSILHAA